MWKNPVKICARTPYNRHRVSIVMDGDAIRRLYVLSDDQDDRLSADLDLTHTDTDSDYHPRLRGLNRSAPSHRHITSSSGDKLTNIPSHPKADDAIDVIVISDNDVIKISSDDDDIISITGDEHDPLFSSDNADRDACRLLDRARSQQTWTPSRRLSGSGRYFNQVLDITIRCFNCDGVGHRKSECESLPKSVPCFLCGQHGHDARRCIHDRRLQCSALFCWLCSRPHHDAQRCLQTNLSSPSAQRLHCFVCGRQGHYNCGQHSVRHRDRDQCPNCAGQHPVTECHQPRLQDSVKSSDLDGYEIRSIKCYTCGSTEHKEYQCRKARRRARESDNHTGSIRKRQKKSNLVSTLPKEKKRSAIKKKKRLTHSKEKRKEGVVELDDNQKTKPKKRKKKTRSSSGDADPHV